MNNRHHHSKKDFQVERLVFFSDAVFAIAITLLVIDLKVPSLHGLQATEQVFIDKLLGLTPVFLGFCVSFFIIGLYWFIHHRMFGFVTEYSAKLIWLNLLFLFSIVLMPFSTSVYSEYSSPEYIHLVFPYLIYVLNICLTGALNYALWKFIGNTKNRLADDFQGDFIKKAKIRALILPLVFIISFAVSIFDPVTGRFVLFLTPLAMSLVKNKKQNSDL